MKRLSHVDVIPNPFSHNEYKPMFLQLTEDPLISNNGHRLGYANSISSQQMIRKKNSASSFLSQQQLIQASANIHRNELTKRISIIEKNINEIESILNDASSVIIRNDDAASRDYFYETNDNNSVITENSVPQYARNSQNLSELSRTQSLSSDMMRYKLNELKNKLSDQIAIIDYQSEYATSINDDRSVRSIDSSVTRFRNSALAQDVNDFKLNIDVLKHRVIQKRLSDTSLSSKLQNKSSFSNMKDSGTNADGKLYIIRDTLEKPNKDVNKTTLHTSDTTGHDASTITRVRGLRYSQYINNAPSGKLQGLQDSSSDVPPPRSELRYRDKGGLNSLQFTNKPSYIQGPTSSARSVRLVRSVDSLRYSDVAKLVDASKLQQLNAVKDLSEKRVDVIRQKLNNRNTADAKSVSADSAKHNSSAVASSYSLHNENERTGVHNDNSTDNKEFTKTTTTVEQKVGNKSQAQPAFDASVYDPEILNETSKYLNKYKVENNGSKVEIIDPRIEEKNEEKDKLSELKCTGQVTSHSSLYIASGKKSNNKSPAQQSASTPVSPLIASESSFNNNNNNNNNGEIPYRNPNHLSYQVSKRRSFNTLKNSTVVQSYNNKHHSVDTRAVTSGSGTSVGVTTAGVTAAGVNAAVAAASSYGKVIVRPVSSSDTSNNKNIPVSPSLGVLDTGTPKKKIGNLNSSISMSNINNRRHHYRESDKVEAVAYDGKDISVKKPGLFKKFVYMFKKK